jgi:hypothetical protein
MGRPPPEGVEVGYPLDSWAGRLDGNATRQSDGAEGGAESDLTPRPLSADSPEDPATRLALKVSDAAQEGSEHA